MSRDADLPELGAVALAALVRDGKVTAEAVTQACLARTAEREPVVQAWQFLDAGHALTQARARDAQKRAGKPIGPLHGVPVGLKDIIDTADMPTENGTVLCAGRRPTRDAAVALRLRNAGAVILGKTVTTELAVFHPGETRNPHDPERTPGGSSSGSAAAVADRMVPLALGSQTNGSVIRPASFCGVVGFKPTHGLISRAGMLLQSRTLDHVGLFARSVEDVALLGDVLGGHDERDPDTRLGAAPRLLETATAEWPLQPDLAFVRTPVWDQAEPSTQEAFAELVLELGDRVAGVELPDAFAGAHAAHQAIMEADEALNYGPLWERGRDQLSPVLRQMIERGQAVTAVDWHRAVQTAAGLRRSLQPLFDRHDAILTPAAPGEAPKGLGATGSPVFCTIWTLLGLPAVCLPLLQGPAGMPLGVQLVGSWGDDARLLRTASWLVRRLSC
jgi:Asp-tRNA(Asn)/Glu-tRNA(Gln) amidotransferase A subunit family amidase